MILILRKFKYILDREGIVRQLQAAIYEIQAFYRMMKLINLFADTDLPSKFLYYPSSSSSSNDDNANENHEDCYVSKTSSQTNQTLTLTELSINFRESKYGFHNLEALLEEIKVCINDILTIKQGKGEIEYF